MAARDSVFYVVGGAKGVPPTITSLRPPSPHRWRNEHDHGRSPAWTTTLAPTPSSPVGFAHAFRDRRRRSHE